ncbi:MAG: hypothetical protein KAT77_00455 [Nanoarchaeota archaeon]|nr:hypothetical protein [Nanoarchaeota archaeon]
MNLENITGKMKKYWLVKEKLNQFKIPLTALFVAGTITAGILFYGHKNKEYDEGLFNKYDSIKTLVEKKDYSEALDLLTILKEELKGEEKAKLVGLSKNVERMERRINTEEVNQIDYRKKTQEYMEKKATEIKKSIEWLCLNKNDLRQGDRRVDKIQEYMKKFSDTRYEIDCFLYTEHPRILVLKDYLEKVHESLYKEGLLIKLEDIK